MNSRIYLSLLFLAVAPFLVLCLTTIQGQQDSLPEAKNVKIKVEVIKAELRLKLDDNAENKIQAEILSQNIKTQKCSEEPWCNFIPAKKNNGPHYSIFSFNKINEYQKITVYENMKILKGQPRGKLQKQFGKFLTGPCPRNLSVAWLKKMDLGGEVVPESEKVYEFVKECTPETSHEEMYVRQALHYYGLNQKDKAVEAITKALSVINDEGVRINYWAAEILQDKKYYQEVVEHYTFSWHAVLAANKLGEDLFSKLEKRPQYELKESINPIVPWVELLLHYKKFNDLDVFLKWNINNESIDTADWFYINRLVVQYAPVNIGLNLTTRLANNKPNYVNLQILDFSFPHPYQDIFYSVKAEVDFDPFLIMSLTKQESGFDAAAKSPAKAWGLMQLLPATAKHVAGKKPGDLKDPQNNINLGVQYLSTLYRQLGTVEYALAAYNAGPSRVFQWLKYEPTKNNILLFMDLIPFKETRSYVALILRNHYFYRHLNGAPEAKKVESEQFKDLRF